MLLQHHAEVADLVLVSATNPGALAKKCVTPFPGSSIEPLLSGRLHTNLDLSSPSRDEPHIHHLSGELSLLSDGSLSEKWPCIMRNEIKQQVLCKTNQQFTKGEIDVLGAG